MEHTSQAEYILRQPRSLWFLCGITNAIRPTRRCRLVPLFDIQRANAIRYSEQEADLLARRFNLVKELA